MSDLPAPFPVVVLMASYNAGAYLAPQLESIWAQSAPPVEVRVGDDGSTDGTWQALQASAAGDPRLTLRQSAGQGANANFLALLDPLPEGCAVAFSDQDDIWLEDKLARASAALAALPQERPALYCARRWIWRPDGGKTLSKPYPAQADFANALTENIAPGNTIMLNPAAARLAHETRAAGMTAYAYDWWLLQLVLGCGGQVIWDEAPVLLYRQHEGNLIGAGETARVSGKLAALDGRYAARISQQLDALEQVAPRFTAAHRATLHAVQEARRAPLPARLRGLRRAGLWRQGRLSNIAFWIGASLGRV